mmetsp:Transcript_36832/g.82255  ORF Transcript_36832/g.82255 Transcript_36832/m.82255 type:complete len:96 (-) Transcript_36832:1030-1317(-)
MATMEPAAAKKQLRETFSWLRKAEPAEPAEPEEDEEESEEPKSWAIVRMPMTSTSHIRAKPPEWEAFIVARMVGSQTFTSCEARPARKKQERKTR